MKRVLFAGEAVTFANPKTTNDRNVLTQIDNRIRTIGTQGGRARGRLLGGNLSVLTDASRLAYVPSLDGAILFLEDVGEEQPYRVDRMMTQLRTRRRARRGFAAFVFGTCCECTPGGRLRVVHARGDLRRPHEPLGIPAWQGAMIGHSMTQWTLPVAAMSRSMRMPPHCAWSSQPLRRPRGICTKM